MRAKIPSIECILLLALVSTNVNGFTVAPNTVVGDAGTYQVKHVSEDPTAWKREPFKSTEISLKKSDQTSSQTISSSSPDFVLQGIMKCNSRYYAIINGRTVKPGDRVEGWSVTGISRYRVTMNREKHKQIYDIYQGKIDRGTK